MKEPRVAVIGGRGQLGSDLVRVLTERGGYYVQALGRDELEIASPDVVQRILEPLRPDVVVNCAAFVRVDECEDRPEEAFRVNTVGALHVARACAEIGAVCVYISTDYVFDGTKGYPYTEEDTPRPLNVYGVSKLAGEFLVRAAAFRWLIVRTSSLFGRRGSRAKSGNFVDTILRKARAAETLRLVTDIRMSPTYSHDAAEALEQLIRHEAEGTVHVTNAGSCTWFQFAETILRFARVEARLEAVTAQAFGSKAARPRDSSLSSVRLARLEGGELRSWEDAVAAYLGESGAS